MSKTRRQRILEYADLGCAHRPVKDGIQTAVELREWEVQQKRQRKLPLCAVTGNASDASIKRIKDAGMDFVLSKPYQIGDLLEYVRYGLLTPVMFGQPG